MKRLVLLGVLLGAVSANAVESSEFIGTWKYIDSKCASGKKARIAAEEIIDYSLNMKLTVLNSNNFEARTAMSYSYRPAFLKKTRDGIAESIAILKKLESTPEIEKSIANSKK